MARKRRGKGRKSGSETVHSPAVSGDNPKASSQPRRGGEIGSGPADDPGKFLDVDWSRV